MQFGLIKNDEIVEIALGEREFFETHHDGYELMEITGEPGTPSKGWIRRDGVWSEPDLVPVDNSLAKKTEAMQFGQSLMAEFSVLNDERGLTVNQRLQLTSLLSPIQSMLLVGDLVTVRSVLSGITPDGVLLTQSILDSFNQKITDFLNR